MSEVVVCIPDRQVSVLNVPQERMADELRMLAAVKLFELGRLSSGSAAEFAGIPKPLFLQRLGDYGVSVFEMTDEEFAQETRLG